MMNTIIITTTTTTTSTSISTSTTPTTPTTAATTSISPDSTLPLFSLVPALAAADAAPPKAQTNKAAPTTRGQPLKSKLANAWEKVKELGRKVKEKVKKEKEAVLRKHGGYRELLGEEDDDDDEEEQEEGELF